jgi:hypothetical protein
MKTLSITNNDLFRLSMAGAIALALASLFIGASHPLGYGVALLAPLVLTINSGVELDFEQLKYRKFKSVLGIKSGEWKSYNPAHQLVLLSKHGAKTMVNQRLISEIAIEDYFYELYIMDPSHLKRLYLYSTKKKEKVDSIIRQITESSTLKLTAYNPAKLNGR